ncbi:HAD family hydrolase [Salinirubrum litoreum]|uniref:HAD family hydrolase n=1 Tax=Salinirubrum litoreum TaxID=1126234 RepID=A0ABD5R9I4_9EURY
MYDAVIFDNDGVLVDLADRSLLVESTRIAFETVGVTDPAEEHVEAMTLGVAPETVHRVAETYGVDPETLWASRDHASSVAQQDAIRAGQKSLYDDVDAVAGIELPKAIVSTNQQTTIDFLLSHFDMAHLFDPAIGREPTVESLHRKKPNPYYLDRAVRALDARNPLFVGDSDSDVAAAEAVGIDSAFVRRSHRAGHTPEPDPTHDLDSLYDLHGILDG